MKKYFLKGKAYIHQKMGQFDIEHDKLDLVNDQTPKKHQQTFKILSSKDIDLQSFQKYSPYYRTYPNHPIAPLLLDKIKQQTKIMEPPYIQQIRVQKNKVPMIDQDLEQKAYKLRNIVQGYDQELPDIVDPLLGIGVVQFHHKRGADIEFVYPKSEVNQNVFNSVIPFAMPDSSHNKMEDCCFFNMIMKVGEEEKMVYGVSYFKQIKITEEMKKNNPQLTRSHLQKSICLLCYVPLFGQFRLKIMGIIENYFSNLSDFTIISSLYDDIKNNFQQNGNNIGLAQLHLGVDTLSLFSKFKANLLSIFKSILYNKRVIFYSQSAYSSSVGILSALSLFPGQLAFTLRSTILDKYLQGLRQFALPLKIFSIQQPLYLSANIQIMSKLKSLSGGFVIGTSNQMLIESLNYDLLVDFDKGQLKWNKQLDEEQFTLFKDDKVFIGVLNRMSKGDEDIGQNWIKDYFHNYLKLNLAKIADIRHRYNQFITSCRAFEDAVMYSKKNPKNDNYRNYEKFDEQIKDQNELVMKIPQFDQSLNQIPLEPMISKPYFRYFLEFSNPQLYILSNNYSTQDFLMIDNFEYYLGDFPRYKSKYTTYNFKTKKLRISNLKSTEKIKVKQLKFNSQNIVSQIFIGDYDGSTLTYNGHGVLINAYQSYEGGFKKGMKDGFGKLVTNTQTYIGTFHEGLYHGDGHLIIHQNNTIYVGMFKEGVKEGFGKLQTPIYYYEGEFSQNQMSGNGSMTILASKIKYFGSFANNKLYEKDSQSVIRFPNGDVYTGTTKDLQMHGRGVLHRNEGDPFEGEFENGMPKNQENE